MDNAQKRRYLICNKFVKDYKKKLGCQICGWNEHPEILVIHHKQLLYRKQGQRRAFGSGTGNLNKIKDELKGCLVLCRNCHAWVHYKENKLNYNKRKSELPHKQKHLTSRKP